MGTKKNRTLLKMIAWAGSLSILLILGCETLEQILPARQETRREPSQPAPRPEETAKAPVIRPLPEVSSPPSSSVPPEPRVVEKTLPQPQGVERGPSQPHVVEKVLPQPEIIERVFPEPEATQEMRPQPRNGEKTGPPVSEGTEKAISREARLLNPAVPQDARMIQILLADLGFYSGAIDGIWGKGSQAALTAFKQEQSLQNPEKWDLETQMLLFRGRNQ